MESRQLPDELVVQVVERRHDRRRQAVTRLQPLHPSVEVVPLVLRLVGREQVPVDRAWQLDAKEVACGYLVRSVVSDVAVHDVVSGQKPTAELGGSGDGCGVGFPGLRRLRCTSYAVLLTLWPILRATNSSFRTLPSRPS